MLRRSLNLQKVAQKSSSMQLPFTLVPTFHMDGLLQTLVLKARYIILLYT